MTANGKPNGKPPKKGKPPISPTGAVALAVREMAEKALQLRRAGWSYVDIARELKGPDGKSRTVPRIHQMVTALLRESRELVRQEAELLLELELERLDWIQRTTVGVIAAELAKGAAMRPDAVFSGHRTLLMAMKRRASLLGLDAPTVLKLDFGQLSDEQLERLQMGEPVYQVLGAQGAQLALPPGDLVTSGGEPPN